MRFLLLLVTASALLAESVAGLNWTSPAGWTNQGSRPMRAATYVVPGDAECVVYFFGEGQGGSIEANLDRWKGQFQRPDGKVADAKIATRTVHGMKVTTIDGSGTYSGAAGPTAREKIIKTGYRLLGAIIEGPGGNVFIKFTGPEKALNANQAKFEQLLASFNKK